MRKIKFFSLLSITLFLFSCISVICTKASTDYVFNADWNMSGENNLFTIGSESGNGQAYIEVSGVDLTQKVYVSLKYKSVVTDLDLYAYDPDTDYIRVSYHTKTNNTGNVTENESNSEYIITTCEISSQLVENSIDELTHLKYTFRGAVGDTVEILDFAITTDGAHGFETTGDSGSGEVTEPETPVEPSEKDFVFTADYAMTGENNVFTMDASKSCVITQVENVDMSNVYISIKYYSDAVTNFDIDAYDASIGSYVCVSYKVEANTTGNVTEYEKYGNNDFIIVTANVTSLLAENSFTSLDYVKYTFRGAAGNVVEILDFAITTDGVHGFDTTVDSGSGEVTEPEEPIGELTIGDLTTSATATIVKNENAETVVKYTTSPGWDTFKANVSNYQSDLVNFEVKFTVNETSKLCFSINGNIDWSIGHKEYAAGTYTEVFDVTSYSLPQSFVVEFYLDAEVEVLAEKTLTIHSMTFKGVEQVEPEPDPVYDPTQPTVYGEITLSSSNTSTLEKNENNEQVIKYTTSPGWSTFRFTVSNYNPEHTELELVYSSNETFVMCVAINGKYEGHISYPAGENKVVRLDFSDEKYQLGVEFRVEIYLDATVEVTSEKVITVHSYQFKTPEPEPEGMVIEAPKGDGITCVESEDGNGYDLSYEAGKWRNVSFTVKNHEVNYDVIKLALDLTEGTNLGIRIYYINAAGEAVHLDVRSHYSLEGVAQTTGTYELVYLLEAYGIKGLVLTKVELWFDCPTDYTTNSGTQTAKLYSLELLDSTTLDLAELEFSLEDTVVDYTGEAAALQVECAEEVTFKMEHAQVVENEEPKWFTGVPTNAGTYLIRVTYMGSLKYNYKTITANLTINKVQATITAADLTVDQATGLVTIKEGVEASTSEEFAAGSEVVNGDVVEFGTTIYYRVPGNENVIGSETLSVHYEMTLEQYQDATILVLTALVGDYQIDTTEYVAAIRAAETEDAVDLAFAAASQDILDKQAEIDASNTLASVKTTAKETLAAYKAADLYREAEQATLAQAITDGNAAIDAAETQDAVDQALAAAKTAIDGIKTKAQYEEEEQAAAQALAAAKTTAKEALAAYKAADLYREAEQATLASAITAGNTAIDAAETLDAVEQALQAAKTAIDAIKTKAQYEGEEAQAAAKALSDAKVAAIQAVVNAIGTYNIDKASYETAINAATSLEAVASALESALTDVQAKKTTIDQEQNTNDPNESEEPGEKEPEKKGCKGSVLPSIFGIVTLLGVCIVAKRKKDEE